MTSPLAHQIEKKIQEGIRINPEEGLFLLTEAPLLWLGQLAMETRFRCNPGNRVTFVADTNPNYTNICDTDCHFCAFFRRPQNAEAYTLSVSEVMAKIEKAVQYGATTVLLQGGHNPNLPLEYYLELLKETKRRFPDVTPHFFSASEIITMSRISGLSVQEVLSKLKEAGQNSLPGGGAEILSERVRREIAPKKGGPEEWLSVHREAHRLGFISTATMMYGHIETPEDIVKHWNSLRDLQDESTGRNNGGGFTAFVPWSFKPDNSILGRRISRKAGPTRYFRLLAGSRLYLDNFKHIQASWFSEGKKTGQIALHFGADDFGGTLYEENVHAEAGFVNSSNSSEVISLIHEAGFDAVQRTTRYDEIEVFPKENHPSASNSSFLRKQESRFDNPNNRRDRFVTRSMDSR